MKNSQFFREKSAKSFRSQNSLDMEPAVYLPARKGGRHLKDMDGMTYALSKRRENKTYYFCTQRNSLKCPATAIVDSTLLWPCLCLGTAPYRPSWSSCGQRRTSTSERWWMLHWAPRTMQPRTPTPAGTVPGASGRRSWGIWLAASTTSPSRSTWPPWLTSSTDRATTML